MGRIVHASDFGISQASQWPYAENHILPHIESKGAWVLAMDAGGLVTIWPKDAIGGRDFEKFGAITFFYSDDLDKMRRFCVTFCSRGYDTDPRLLHTDGTMWGFNWVSGTIAQIRVAALVAQAFFHSDSREDYDAAWMVGRAFEEQLNAAVNELYQASR